MYFIIYEQSTFTAHASMWLQTAHVQRLSQHMTSALSVCLNLQASLALIRSLGRHTHTTLSTSPWPHSLGHCFRWTHI